MTARRARAAALVLAAVSGAAGCAGGAAPAAPPSVARSATAPATAAAATSAPAAPTTCPLTVDDVASTLETPVRRRGVDCVFDSARGTVTFTVEAHPGQGAAAFAAAREQARRTFGDTADPGTGRPEFVAGGAGAGQATALADDRLYTVSVRGFGFPPDGYRTVTQQLIVVVLG